MAQGEKLKLLLTGATGLVGQGVLHEVLLASDIAKVTVLGRRPTGRTDPRLEEVHVADLAILDAFEGRLRGFDACLYCAGVPPFSEPETRYRAITVDITTAVARTLARLNPGMRFQYVSGANANASSVIMPLRVKGEVEAALQRLDLRTTMLRPGGIQPVHGERSPHRTLAAFYGLAAPFMGLGVKLVPSLMTTTARMGRAMLELARMPDPPAVVENAKINELGG